MKSLSPKCFVFDNFNRALFWASLVNGQKQDFFCGLCKRVETWAWAQDFLTHRNVKHLVIEISIWNNAIFHSTKCWKMGAKNCCCWAISTIISKETKQDQETNWVALEQLYTRVWAFVQNNKHWWSFFFLLAFTTSSQLEARRRYRVSKQFNCFCSSAFYSLFLQ